MNVGKLNSVQGLNNVLYIKNIPFYSIYVGTVVFLMIVNKVIVKEH